MEDLVVLAHLIIGLSLAGLSIIILLQKKESPWLKPLSFITAALSWFLLFPAGYLYIKFYPTTKAMIKAGSWPWAHSIFMETKEHWGLLLPLITTLAAILVFKDNHQESKRWWILVIILSILLGVMGRIITLGALK